MNKRESLTIPKLAILILAALIIGTTSLGQVIDPEATGAFSPGKIGFILRIRDFQTDYAVMTTSVMPGEKLKLEIDKDFRTGTYEVRLTDGKVTESSDYRWVWQAPDTPGLCRLTISRLPSGDSMTLNVFVLAPMKLMQGGYLNGYRIGKYPSIPYRGLPSYNPPKGFIEVTEENFETRVSPHFTLGQFICKQNGGFPKYIVLREHLLLKLELILQKVNKAGYYASTFTIMSGYRTPFYNKSIGNVKYSRHQWGGAADIFIDENPADGMMDDLNGDGAISWKDADVIYELIDEMVDNEDYQPFIGGLARYKKTNNHGPFVHIDVRGFHARWGD